jgi:hypothetical protein
MSRSTSYFEVLVKIFHTNSLFGEDMLDFFMNSGRNSNSLCKKYLNALP